MNIRKKWATLKGDFKKWRDHRKSPLWSNQGYYVRCCEKLPLDDRAVLLETQLGHNIEGNVFWIARELATDPRYAKLTVSIAVRAYRHNKYRKMLDCSDLRNVRLVEYGSRDYYRLLATAKYLFNDVTFVAYFHKRPGQVYANLWHGTPLKALGKAMATGFAAIGNVQRNFCEADYLLFPNEFTRDVIVRDYMLDSLSNARGFLCGYPRTAALADESVRVKMRTALKADDGTRIYAYMPTFRGAYRVNDAAGIKDRYRLVAYLLELDRELQDNEKFYLNLHPSCAGGFPLELFKHIRFFWGATDTYQFLSAADVLITDYSSVFFDFAASGRKIVLFPYDKEEYLEGRGLYMGMDELPFPQVRNVPDLLRELRSPKAYDDAAFRARFNAYDGADTPARICRGVVSGDWTMPLFSLKDGDRDGVLLYMGMITQNGITGAMLNLLTQLDLSKRRYCVGFESSLIGDNDFLLRQLPEGVAYYGRTGDTPLTGFERTVRYAWKKLHLPTRVYAKLCGAALLRECERVYGAIGFKTAVHYEGYNRETLISLMRYPGNRLVFVHSDMVREMKSKGYVRKDIVSAAYSEFSRVVGVSVSAVNSAKAFLKDGSSVVEVANVIPQEKIADAAKRDLEWDFDDSNVPLETIQERLEKPGYKFISVGRFSVEKGHERLVRAFAEVAAENPDSQLFIVGGYGKDGVYERLLALLEKLRIADRVTLIVGMKRPMPLVLKCDGFVLSSFYEGLPLVISEAQICGKPVVSTDIPSVRAFLDEYGGLTVPQSEEGLADGMRRLLDGKVPFRPVDYTERNRRAVADFEALLS